MKENCTVKLNLPTSCTYQQSRSKRCPSTKHVKKTCASHTDQHL